MAENTNNTATVEVVPGVEVEITDVEKATEAISYTIVSEKQ